MTDVEPRCGSGSVAFVSEEAVEPTEHDAETLGVIDLAGIEADLDGVQTALSRLADGTYWTDEVTGDPIPPGVLTADPLARRA